MSISISTNIVFPMSPLFFEMMSSYFSHSLSKAFCVFGDMSLSFNSTFLCTGASAGDFKKSSSFLHEWVFEKFTELFLPFSLWYPYWVVLFPVVPWCKFLTLLLPYSLSPRKLLHGPWGGVSVRDD